MFFSSPPVQYSAHLIRHVPVDASHLKMMLSATTWTALILFQRGACICSLGQNVVECLKCGHHRACHQNQHSCEIRVR